jgi:hypothetical protein
MSFQALQSSQSRPGSSAGKKAEREDDGEESRSPVMHTVPCVLRVRVDDLG